MAKVEWVRSLDDDRDNVFVYEVSDDEVVTVKCVVALPKDHGFVEGDSATVTISKG